jgi:mono/diheme cytochrome c family protein
MLKPLLLVPALLIFGYHSASPPASASQQSSPASSASGAKTAGKTGNEIPPHVKKIYEVDCALCHGATGNGKTDLATDMKLTMSDLTDPKTLASKTDQQLFDLIRKGNGQMPPEEEGRAKNDEVKSLIVYLRNMSKGQPASTTPPAAPAAAPAQAPGTN